MTTGDGEERCAKGQERPVGPAEPRTWRTPSQDLDLMAKHNDLDVLVDAAETMNAKKLDGAPKQTEEVREGHDREGSLHLPCPVKLAF